jgi:hypothetical protein
MARISHPADGSKRDGVRQLFMMRLTDRFERRLTDLKPGYAAMWPHWQPAATPPISVSLRKRLFVNEFVVAENACSASPRQSAPQKKAPPSDMPAMASPEAPPILVEIACCLAYAHP